MKNGDYEGIEQIEADLMLIFENAKRYNMPNSTIYKRAQRLQQIMQVSSLVRNPLQEYPSVSGKWEKKGYFFWLNLCSSKRKESFEMTMKEMSPLQILTWEVVKGKGNF